MDFQEYLKTSAEEIEKESVKFFNQWKQDVEEISPKLTSLINVFTEACEGGKRLRGVFVKLGFEITGAKYDPDILKPAVGYEIFNTAILAHDDILDLSPLRRGKPSMYMSFGGDHYGTSQAIVWGDVGLFLSIHLIQKTNFPPVLKDKATACLTKNIIDTALGEILDVELSTKVKIREENDVLKIAHLKTAQYTITGPLQIGAILGGADQVLLDKIENFGESLGIAFQIQDDILGVFGDEVALGKSVTSDIEEGKNTLLITEALKNANSEQKEVLAKYYGKGKVKEDEVEQIKQVFADTNALAYSQKRAQEYVTIAKKLIPEITDNDKYRELLEQMSEFLVKRTK